MYKAQRVLNADGMGAGKTAQTIGAILLNKMDGKPYRTLIICPSSMKGTWKKEIEAVTDELNPVVLDSSMEKRFEVYEEEINRYDVAIISYDGFIADYDELAKYFKPDIIVLDECHRIANRQNKITQALIGGRKIKKTFTMMCSPHSVYLLTGTPISNRLEDLYAMLKFIDPGIFSWTGFGNRYTIVEEAQRWLHNGGVSRPHTYQKIVGYRNEKELKAKLSLHMIRRTKDEILPELPEKVFQIIEIDLDEEERKIYKDLKDDYKASIRGKELSVTDALTWMTRAQQIANSLETVPGSGTKKSSKLAELIRIVEAEAPNRKILIFSKYKTMTNIIERELKHLHPLHLNGDTPAEDRTPMIDKFQNDQKHRVFISTIKAGGVGITLTAADLVIFYDIAWTPAANAQAADRVHRIGQKNSVLVLTLRARNTVDERLFDVCMGKQGVVDEMLGDEKSVMARLTQERAEDLI
jgi:SNF2 family DNA or RNA helicase